MAQGHKRVIREECWVGVGFQEGDMDGLIERAELVPHEQDAQGCNNEKK